MPEVLCQTVSWWNGRDRIGGRLRGPPFRRSLRDRPKLSAGLACLETQGGVCAFGATAGPDGPQAVASILPPPMVSTPSRTTPALRLLDHPVQHPAFVYGAVTHASVL